MEKTTLIKDYVEGRISPVQFRDELYKDPSFEDYFKDSKPIPPYTSSGYGIYLYLLERDFKSITDIINTQDMLSQFLFSKGITNKPDTKILHKSDLISKAQPKWLDLAPDYIECLLNEAGNLEGKELTNWLKKAIAERFICISVPPKWLQSPNWPIENNTPLVFVGQLDISKISHDTSYLYIFFNPMQKEYKQVIQSH
jgi:hypothetical protein